jgi:hypothetical protein
MSAFSKFATRSAVINGIKAASVGAVMAVGMMSIPVSAAPGAQGSGPCVACTLEQPQIQSPWTRQYVRQPGPVYYPAPVTRGDH